MRPPDADEWLLLALWAATAAPVALWALRMTGHGYAQLGTAEYGDPHCSWFDRGRCLVLTPWERERP